MAFLKTGKPISPSSASPASKAEQTPQQSGDASRVGTHTYCDIAIDLSELHSLKQLIPSETSNLFNLSKFSNRKFGF